MLELKSPVFEDGGTIPNEFTCDGENVSPPLEIVDIPDGTESMVLIVDDPDAPSGSFVHWLVWNIPAETVAIEAGELPDETMEGYNDFGKPEYSGPCPPSGSHRYFFRLFAIDTVLEDLDEDTGRAKIEKLISGHILDEAVLVGEYSRRHLPNA